MEKTNGLSRRDFLKLIALASASIAAKPLAEALQAVEYPLPQGSDIYVGTDGGNTIIAIVHKGEIEAWTGQIVPNDDDSFDVENQVALTASFSLDGHGHKLTKGSPRTSNRRTTGVKTGTSTFVFEAGIPPEALVQKNLNVNSDEFKARVQAKREELIEKTGNNVLFGLGTVQINDVEGKISSISVHFDGQGIESPYYTLHRIDSLKNKQPTFAQTGVRLARIAAVATPTIINPEYTPTPEAPVFQNTELAEQLGYSTEELKDKDYIGVERGDEQIADLTYNGLLGIKRDGTKELIGLQFVDNFVKLSAKEIMEFSAQVPAESFTYSATYNPLTHYVNIHNVSTGIIENHTIYDPNGEIAGYIQTHLAVTNDANGNPRLIRVPMQAETAESMGINLFKGALALYSNYTAEYGKVYSMEELAQFDIKGKGFNIGIPKAGPNLDYELGLFFKNIYDKEDYYIDEFLETGTEGVTADPQNPLIVFATKTRDER